MGGVEHRATRENISRGKEQFCIDYRVVSICQISDYVVKMDVFGCKLHINKDQKEKTISQ